MRFCNNVKCTSQNRHGFLTIEPHTYKLAISQIFLYIILLASCVDTHRTQAIVNIYNVTVSVSFHTHRKLIVVQFFRVLIKRQC
jgi:hypothetical protein